MTTAAVAFGLVAIAVIALAVVGMLLGSDDDDDIDLREYADWERLR
jgi:hypothetical protein